MTAIPRLPRITEIPAMTHQLQSTPVLLRLAVPDCTVIHAGLLGAARWRPYIVWPELVPSDCAIVRACCGATEHCRFVALTWLRAAAAWAADRPTPCHPTKLKLTAVMMIDLCIAFSPV